MIFKRWQKACKTPIKKSNQSELKIVSYSYARCKNSTAFEFSKIKEILKSYKTNHKTDSTNTKNQNQINIVKKVSMKIAHK